MADVNIQIPSLPAASAVGTGDLTNIRQGSQDKKVTVDLLRDFVLDTTIDADTLNSQPGSYYNDSANLTGTISPDRIVNVNDRAGTDRTSGWVPGLIAFSSTRSMNTGDLNNIVRATASSISFNTATAVATAGDTIQIINPTAASITIGQGGGFTINWLKGGALSTGSRTLAAYSVATLHFHTSSAASLWGNGLS